MAFVALLVFLAVGLCGAQVLLGISQVKTICDGQLKGGIAKTAKSGMTYYFYQGIPYAEPPVGNLRFSPPMPKKKWTGILNATRVGSQCTQGSDSPTGSEDCLYLNVYSPTLQNESLPVMVYIHGGGFNSENSSYQSVGPDYLLEENIVFVAMNYRLGIFGFISTEDLVSPGNNGLRDQLLALKWVRNNIANFGGDPKKVTLFGESAGSVSVSYHIQSKQSSGLFRSAIMESGSSLCLWSMNRRAKRIAVETAKNLKLNTSSSTSVINGLRSIDNMKLQKISQEVAWKITLENPLAGILFSPVMEPYHDGAFFYNNSYELLEKGDFNRVPTIMGVNSDEASGDIPAILRPLILKYVLNYSLLAPADLTSNALKRIAAGTEVNFHYSGLTPLALTNDQLFKFISDDQFNRPVRQNVIQQSKYAPVYYYVFSYEGRLGGKVNRTRRGVGHAEELGYIFRISSRTTNSPLDELMRSKTVKLWTNFAKYSSPTPQKEPLLQNVTWLESNSIADNIIYMNLDQQLELKLNPFQQNMEFYDELYKKYGTRPYNTY